MRVFPQFVSGAAALYPLIKRHHARAVVNELGDGSAVVFDDLDAAQAEWEIRARGLTLDEASAIEALFDSTSGRAQTFIFLDPVGNLLARSEELDASVWANDPLLQFTNGIADPFGATRATRVVNQGQAVQAVTQALAAPGTFQYCLSVWARGLAGSGVTLSLSTAGANVTRAFALTGQWVRLTFAGKLGPNTEQMIFGARLDAGASVDLFGMQVEAQPAASDYKRTGATGGVRARARFAEDSIRVTAQGTDVYDAAIRIVSPGS